MVRANEAVAEMLAALNNERDKSKALAARVVELEAENARLRGLDDKGRTIPRGASTNWSDADA